MRRSGKILTFGVSLAILAAALTYFQVKARNDAIANATFDALVDRTATAISDRVRLFQYGLRGARGAVVALGPTGLTRERFHAYAATRDLDFEFRGARGFGFIRRVQNADLAVYLEQARADGWPDFSLRALDDAVDDHYVIQYIEPVSRNSAAVGLDIATEPRRRAAAQWAVKTNSAAITEPITLVQETGKEARSFLLLLPAYLHGADVATEDQRWAALLGWAYAPILIDDVLAGIPGQGTHFHLRVSDTASVMGVEPFFASPRWAEYRGFVRKVEVDAYNRTWTIEIAGTRRFLDDMGLVSPGFSAMVVGLGVFLVAAVIAFRRSLQVASKATARAEAESEAKSVFLANISHEIRTPMNAILGMLQLLRRSPLQSAQRSFVDKAESAANFLLGVLNDVLDFSRAESGRMTLDPVSFSPEALFQAVGSVVMGAGDRAEVEVLFEVDPRIPLQVKGDDLRLKQVLINLLGNALKFTERGEVILSARRLGGTDHRAVIEFRVRDTGIGIAEESLTHVFDGFTQAEASTTRRYGGTGLGLAISRRLVALMGGELLVESTLGVGSAFWFELDLEMVQEALPEAEAETLKGLTVLVVDDNPTSLRIISDQCRQLGATVQVALDAGSAMGLAQQGSIDVALIDWRMPGRDGIDLVGQLHALPPRPRPIALLLMTAAARQSAALELVGQHPGLRGLVFKPMSPADLSTAILRALAPAPPLDEAMPPTASGSTPLTGCRVLLVEDNKLNQQVARELLEQEGAQVRVANDGLDALDQLGADPQWPQVILMDIQMPRCDGFECTRRLRSELGLTQPVIAMTANFSSADARREKEAGMAAHVSKPFAIEDLVAVILEVMASGDVAWRTLPAAQPDADLAFDSEGALRRFGHKTASYARALHSFGLEAPRLGEQAAIERDPVARARHLHTLKGLAATVGAMALGRGAAAAEEAVRAGRDDVAAAAVTALGPQIEQATAWAQRTLAESSGAEQPAPDSHVEYTVLLTRLNSIRPLLASNRLEAVSSLEGLASQWHGPRPAVLNAIMTALDSFDFPVALEHLDRWIGELELE